MPEIVRVFRARPRRGREATYEEFLRSSTLPFLRRQKGMRGATIGRSYGQDRTELVVISTWSSAEDLRRAAGKNWEEGVVDAQNEAPLLEDFTVTHFEVLPT